MKWPVVERGADLHHQDKNGDTPLEYAKKWELKEAVEILERLQKEYPLKTMGIRDNGVVEKSN